MHKNNVWLDLLYAVYVWFLLNLKINRSHTLKAEIEWLDENICWGIWMLKSFSFSAENDSLLYAMYSLYIFE